MEDIYKYKYLKYKNKYLKLKGGAIQINYENVDFFFNFNKLKDIILEKYENFKNLNLITDDITYKHKGANGTVHNVTFTKKTGARKRDKINVLIKTPIISTNDNNYYEYVAGLCVNNFKKYFPNFCYTYGYGKITPKLKSELENDPFVNIKPSTFTKNYTVYNLNENDLLKYSRINEGCELNSETSLLIEEVPNSKKLWDYSTDTTFINPTDIDYNLFCVFYQVYITLNALSDKFTHYDLHPGNIMVSEYSKPIIIKYKLKDNREVKFYTKYIPVMIDYGRCFISCLEYDSLINSTNYLNTACNIPNCRRVGTKYNDCFLIDKGVYLQKTDKDIYDTDNIWFNNITPHKTNNSYDLLALHQFMEEFKSAEVDFKRNYRDYFSMMHNPEWFESDSTLKWGTIEQKSDFQNNKIKTISDFLSFLDKYYIEKNYELKVIDKTLCLGEMTIYEDMSTPWDFIKF